MRPLRATVALVLLAASAAGCRREAPPPPPAAREPEPSLLTPLTPDAATAEPAARGNQARVIATVGDVQVRRTGESAWRTVTQGQMLGTDDSVRTAPDARVDLSVDELTVRVHEESELLIQQVEKNALRAQARGHVEGDVPEGKGLIEIQGKGSNATVRTEGGRFSMTADGLGIVAVATVRGQVKLASRGGEVTLKEGQQSRVASAEAAPTPPAKTLSRVLLKVAWPEKETRERTAPITGHVAPGSRVTVQGKRVEVRPDGTFTVDVPLARGKQQIAVIATDVLGRRQQVTSKIVRDDKLELGIRERPAWSE